MVQVPATLRRCAAPCIVVDVRSAAPRGVYGAIGTAGEWGLKHGCVVAYADKGTGSGVHDLATNTVNRAGRNAHRRGTQASAQSNFTANI